ncbi:MAG: 4Fe-4S dicluster domain-containing protein [Eubacteriales bacterium]|nr:4Fe-4S dicluster domain-containing protein [Clostridiales bacterium]MDY5836289.1 4Fe-4S dicluster domain-containing protein [Eubacteriales bacterium]
MTMISAPCINCKHCLPACPKCLDIPAILEVYNELAMQPGQWGMPSAFADWEDHKLPAACIACHRCERQCPQDIKIAEIMARFTAKMEI